MGSLEMERRQVDVGDREDFPRKKILQGFLPVFERRREPPKTNQVRREGCERGCGVGITPWKTKRGTQAESRPSANEAENMMKLGSGLNSEKKNKPGPS